MFPKDFYQHRNSAVLVGVNLFRFDAVTLLEAPLPLGATHQILCETQQRLELVLHTLAFIRDVLLVIYFILLSPRAHPWTMFSTSLLEKT
ncbi:hypothetical protein CCR75_000538 [Bremia lactucae]|uniref:Uncharacterized protein n=1 Tax=Bremia lactucae TaxID=4779 RepID=A0A976IJ67_BRELC|nr:hypothetical protein CCR75_000538 [Bremia lactucae]